jgi:hypothetical protein
MKASFLRPDRFFDNIYQWHNTEYDVRLPIFYRDNTSMTAIYTASTIKLRALLPFADMHPVEMAPGRCLIAFSAFEYRQTDIGPYNEFSIAAIITFSKRSIPGITLLGQLLKNSFEAYILYLPVTSEIARKGGVELGGYPKFIADINFTKNNNMLTCELTEHGTRILALSGKQLPTAKGRLTRFILYTRLNNIPLKSNVYLNPIRFSQSYHTKSASLDIGSGHEICDVLKDLELSRHPKVYQYCPKYEAILFDTKNIIDA